MSYTSYMSLAHVALLKWRLAQKKRKMFDSGHRFRGQGTGLPGSATCIDTDRTFFQALGSGLGVVEKRGGRGTKRGRLGKGNRGSLTDSLHVVVC